MASSLILACITSVICVVTVAAVPADFASRNPVIGMSAQIEHPEQANAPSYIAASYIKHMESAGARIVPIPSAMSDEDLLKLLPHLNGYLYPGGAVEIPESPYYRHAKVVLEYAKRSFDNGSPFPVWGTCMGFEALMVMVAGDDTSVLGTCDSDDVSLPLNFTSHAATSRMFGKAPADVMDTLRTEGVTYNHHDYCVTKETFERNSRLNEFFNVLSYNEDPKGTTFISSIEAKRYPIFATQWHPEKNSFEFASFLHISHTPTAIRMAQYMANMFVDECRKNTQQFPEELLKEHLIYNYKPKYSALTGSAFMQEYWFSATGGQADSHSGKSSSVSTAVIGVISTLAVVSLCVAGALLWRRRQSNRGGYQQVM